MLADLVDRLQHGVSLPPVTGRIKWDENLEELEHAIWALLVVPVLPLAQQVEALASSLSEKLEKKVRTECFGFDFEMGDAAHKALSTALLHGVRNSLSHGLESPNERIAAGKPPTGRLRISMDIEGGLLRVLISDDGRGADFSKILERALSLGVVDTNQAGGMGPAEKLELLFHPGLSTQEAATEISGRGIGLSAIRAAVSEIGGVAFARQEAGTGLELVLELPIQIMALKAVPVRIGGETLWLRSGAFERVDSVRILNRIEHPLAEVLGWKLSGSKASHYLRFGKNSSIPEFLGVDEIGSPQLKLFRRLDPVWETAGPDWLKQWMSASGHSVLACRMSKEKASLGLAPFADPAVILRIVN